MGPLSSRKAGRRGGGGLVLSFRDHERLLATVQAQYPLGKSLAGPDSANRLRMAVRVPCVLRGSYLSKMEPPCWDRAAVELPGPGLCGHELWIDQCFGTGTFFCVSSAVVTVDQSTLLGRNALGAEEPRWFMLGGSSQRRRLLYEKISAKRAGEMLDQRCSHQSTWSTYSRSRQTCTRCVKGTAISPALPVRRKRLGPLANLGPAWLHSAHHHHRPASAAPLPPRKTRLLRAIHDLPLLAGPCSVRLDP